MAASIRLWLTPAASLHCEPGDPGGSALPEEAAATLAVAFGRGPGFGLVQLAGSLPVGELAAAEAFWRDFAKGHLTAALAQGAAPLTQDEAVRWLALAPPMHGGEYLSAETLSSLWQATSDAVAQLQAETGGLQLQDLLSRMHQAWAAVGRVCLSLAENRTDPARPFAMIATYTSRLTGEAKPRHVPLARLMKDKAAAGQAEHLAKIADILKTAAELSPVVQELLASRRIFQPQALTIAEAYAFLQDVPAMEDSGLMVRVPDWWNAANPPRVKVEVTVGATKPKGSGLGAFMDFKAAAALQGEPLSPEEWKKLQEAASGLVFLRGKWVEVDREKLQQALDVWSRSASLAAYQGMTFAQAMRFMVGGGPAPAVAAVADRPEDAADVRPWSEFISGDWLKEALLALQSPETSLPPDLGGELKATLRPYQQAGLAWLWRLHTLGLGGCLADDMGLGKTIQILAFFAALRRAGANAAPSLIVAPATLVPNWLREAAKFTPGLRPFAAHPSQTPASELQSAPAALPTYDVVVTSYGALLRYDWLLATNWNVVVLDEAQAIKNPQSRQTQLAKDLPARQRIALTGTPVENKPQDLWSIFDFINPGLLGTLRQFNEFVKPAAAGDAAKSSFAALRPLVRPYILRRLKTDRTIIADLPDKTEIDVICGLTSIQAAVYDRIVTELRRDLATADGIKRKGLVLAALMKLKQVCNHPALAVGHGTFASEASGKLLRLAEIADEIAARQEKLLVFTQFREMTQVLDRDLEKIFRRPGLVLHGETPVQQRQEFVEQFQKSDGPPYFVLSVKAGGTGLTLTAASHVVHFDRWWNPAVEDQATDRAYRIGQHKNVLVHKFTCTGTVEEKVANLIAGKRGLAKDILGGSGGAEAALTAMSDGELLALLSLDITKATCEA